MSTGEQLDALEGFRSNRFNVLVATTVVEEGLDVRACNVVIKADELTNFRSFIQSQVRFSLCWNSVALNSCIVFQFFWTLILQGRARANVSYFVLMTDDEQKCRSRVGTFLQMEKVGW